MAQFAQPPSRAMEALLAAFRSARRGEPIPVTYKTIEDAGLIPDRTIRLGLPLQFVWLAHQHNCIVWGPHRSAGGEVMCLVEGRA